MDFLRRLAPASATDPTRAVVALPSRFEAEAPLRLTTGRSRAGREETTEGGLEEVPTRDGGGADTRLAGGERAHGRASEPPHSTSGVKVTVHASGAQHPQSPARERALPRVAKIDDDTQSETGRRGHVDAPSRFAAPPSPLTEATVAERSLAFRDEGPVVNVRIGRIEVVAAAAPPLAARRKTAHREGSVPLANFLRGANGSGR